MFLQEAILAIGSASSAISFSETVHNGLHVCLSNVVSFHIQGLLLWLRKYYFGVLLETLPCFSSGLGR